MNAARPAARPSSAAPARVVAVPAMTSAPEGPGGPGLDPLWDSPGGGTGTLVEEETRLRPTDDGDHERFAHYAPKDQIVEAMVTGTPIRALCGKVWVPSRDPNRYPVCPECKEIYEGLPDGGDES
ncbi:MAG: DUF3039 domain-containing protein [Actinomycetales bacterium]